MKLPKFEYLIPETLDDAFSILQNYGEQARILAGGTDLLVKMKHRTLKPLPKYVLNIKRIPGLNYIQLDENGGGLRIGALTTIQEIKSVFQLGQKYPSINQATGLLSTPQIRNLATIGGNLCNASPAAETAPALLTLSASVKIIGKNQERIVPLEEFFLGPGKTVLRNDEILAEIQVPDAPLHSTSVYIKYGKRLSDIALVGVAISIVMDGKICSDVKIALSSVAPTPVRARKTEELMKGKEVNEELIEYVIKAVSEEARPIDDLRAYAALRREKAGSLLKEAIKQALQQIRSGGSQIEA